MRWRRLFLSLWLGNNLRDEVDLKEERVSRTEKINWLLSSVTIKNFNVLLLEPISIEKVRRFRLVLAFEVKASPS